MPRGARVAALSWNIARGLAWKCLACSVPTKNGDRASITAMTLEGHESKALRIEGVDHLTKYSPWTARKDYRTDKVLTKDEKNIK